MQELFNYIKALGGVPETPHPINLFLEGKNMEHKTTDELLELLHWIVCRQRYRLACGIIDGTAYAAECKAERDAIHELEKRGYYER